jgi:toxin ParE1/3/4
MLKAEITEAVIWYNDRSASVRDNFLDEVDAALERIRRKPRPIPARLRTGAAGNVGAVSPYALIYIVSENESTVVACFHGSRNPRVLRERLKT